ncbi:MAG: hypothetical protein HY895_05735 [Deltaproteobacteria bacterium]|nr:hypothetical protein [Deltaproteobacteria bacterium]
MSDYSFSSHTDTSLKDSTYSPAGVPAVQRAIEDKPRPLRVLFAGRSVYHFSYFESIVRALIDRGHAVTVLFDEGWSKNQSDDALRCALRDLPELQFDWSRRRSDKWRKILFGSRELRTVSSYLRRPEQSDFYIKRWQGYLPEPFRRWLENPFFRWVLGLWLTGVSLAGLERLVPPDAFIAKDLGERKPDVIVGTPGNMRFSEEIEYVKAAKRMGIPSVIPVLSWDNLTTKGIFHVLPDVILSWNHAHSKEAVRVHGARHRRVLIIGSPFFDKWFDPDNLILNKGAFIERVGLPNHKRFILYLGSSRNIAKDETWLVGAIAKEIRTHSDAAIRTLGLLIRPHPANYKIYEQIESEGISVWPKHGALPESEEAQRDFFSSLTHCEAVVGINTSGMLDALIADRPVFTVMTEKYRKTQRLAEHFQYLTNSDAVYMSDCPSDLVELIRKLILHRLDPKKEARQKFINNFIRPFGREVSAGYAGAIAIEGIASGISPSRIPERIRRSIEASPLHPTKRGALKRSNMISSPEDKSIPKAV